MPAQADEGGSEMRPTDVDKIAEAIVGSLAGSDPGLLGCGAISSPIAFEVDYLACGTFECGGVAPFDCNVVFGCGATNGAANAVMPFFCPENFGCETGYGPPNCLRVSAFGCDLAQVFAAG